MSRRAQVITGDESAVLGSQAVIGPGAALTLVSLLHRVEYRHELGTMGLSALQVAELEQAVNALRMAAHAHLSATAASGSAAGNGSEQLASSSAWITTRQAAERLGCKERWVRQLAQEGQLTATKLGRGWAVDERAVADYAARRAA